MQRRKIIDTTAPILPGESLGGVKLLTHIKEYKELVSSFSWLDQKTLKDCSVSLFSPFHIGYEMKNTLIMIFDVITGELQRICALKNYEGTLFGKLKIGMLLEQAERLEPRLTYNDFEELFYIKGVEGVTIEVDAYNKYIEVITVHTLQTDE
ncbi:hypothetical protein [Paenibacillus apiarius]|uniref:hypothetical protein n=1 Tax=Paenibacillus apiarius TaxID=46240 RepID=UPI003B3B39E4